MALKTGLWIDHRKAVTVAVTDSGVETRMIISNVEKQLRRAGDSPLKGRSEPEKVPMSDSRQRAYTGHLNRYYDAVIASLGNAQEILLFGPGEAKLELRKRLKKAGLGDRIAAVETVDKMTDSQIATKVRKRFPS